MNTVYYDAKFTDEVRRQRLFEGQLFVYSPRPSSVAFVEFAKTLINEAFAPHDPEQAQFHMSVESYADVLGKLKPQFIHHPESKRHLQSILQELGSDLEKTYFDVPKMRSSTSDNYLTTGIAYAWHPHRDTWYSAPMFQITGGFPFMIFKPITPWLSIHVIGTYLFRIHRTDIISTYGISSIVADMSPNSLNKILDPFHVLLKRWN